MLPPDTQAPDRCRTELRRALIALGYFTRVPIPAWVGWSSHELNRAARYFPLIGAAVGAVAAAVLLAGGLLWPVPVAVVLSMVSTVLLTGAFHEDGLADAADGLGGGYTRARMLDIMQDSRIGSFGALALVLALLAKFAALLELARLDPWLAAVALIVAHAGSRAVALLLMAALPYVRIDADDTKAKPVAEGIGAREWGLGLALGLAPAGLAVAAGMFTAAHLAALLGTGGLVWLAAARYFRVRLGGYTGDCLGATQQVAEIALYLALLATLG